MGTFESVSTAAAAAAVYAVGVDVAVPACCRSPGLNLQPRSFCLCVFFRNLHRDMGVVRVCAAAAAAAAVFQCSLRSFPHPGRCLSSLFLLLCT